MGNLSLNKDSLALLKCAYEKAVEDGVQIFEFKGVDLDVGYAKYVIEYAESEFYG